MARPYNADFYSIAPDCAGPLISCGFPDICPEAKPVLNADFVDGEIHKSSQSMGPWKAEGKGEGANGFHEAFFQKAWDVVGRSVVSFVGRVLEGRMLNPDVTEALIVLIPKVENPFKI